jgi:alkanesulfonate monooxygenase SsuD/methylene tetrahydromethanopterin reductase-like flavin-dependent oxidoreductase (luciferase family)
VSPRPLRLGLALGGAADAADWARSFEWAELADALGLDSLWLPEGHFRRGATASPLLGLAAFAVRTRRVRLATTSLLISVHHPLRVAEEVATIDALSGGRVVLGVGRGFDERLFSGFGVPARERRDRFDEALDAILAAWRGEPLSLAGAFFATQGDVRPRLRAVQRPHPPLVVAAFGQKGLLQAARRGLPYLASPLEPLDVLVENHALHRAHLPPHAEAGRLEVPVMRTVFVADGEAQARRVHEALRADPLRAARASARGALARAAAGEAAERVLVGTPREVIDQIERYREKLGMDLLVARAAVPGASDAECRDSLQRLVSDVWPALRR